MTQGIEAGPYLAVIKVGRRAEREKRRIGDGRNVKRRREEWGEGEKRRKQEGENCFPSEISVFR